MYYKWLELVAVHSDAWLMAVAFFYAAKADKMDRHGQWACSAAHRHAARAAHADAGRRRTGRSCSI